MAVATSTPDIPDEGAATWADDTRTWGQSTNTTWAGWSPRGGATATRTPATSTVTSRDPSR